MRLITAALLFAGAAFGQGLPVRDGCVDTSGSAAAYACNYAITSAAGVTAAPYTVGHMYWFQAGLPNSGADPTINLSSLGPVVIKKVVSGVLTTLAAGDIGAGQWVVMVFDGTYMQALNLGGGTTLAGTDPIVISGGNVSFQGCGVNDGYIRKWRVSGGWTCEPDQTTTGGTGITTFNGLTPSSQSLAIGNTGTAPNWVSAGSTHTLHIPLASTAGTTAGLVPYSFYSTAVTTAGGPYSDPSWLTLSIAKITGLQAALDGKQAAGSYEPAFAAGTIFQYRRGDKTWQTLDTSAVPENGNLYFTNARALSAVTWVTLTGKPSFTGAGSLIVSAPSVPADGCATFSSGDLTSTGLACGSGSGGEANTASNQGSAGVGVFYQKSGVDLQFYKLNPASNKITITLDATNHKIDFDVVPGNLGLTAASVGAIATGGAYADLSSSAKIGPGAAQVAAGNHNHAGVYEPVDATILRQTNLAGSGSATTPARSDHNHSGTYEPVDSTIVRSSGARTLNAITVFDASGKLIASGCTISGNILTCGSGVDSSALILPELTASGHGTDFRIYGTDSQPTSGCVAVSGQPTAIGQTWIDAGSTVTMTDGHVCRLMNWGYPVAAALSSQYIDWLAVSGGASIANKPTIPTASSATPLVDGTAAVGSATPYAREDHVHPTDTSRVPNTRQVNGHPLSADVTVTAADVGATYQLVGNNGTSQTARGRLNFVPGTGISYSFVDNSGNGSTDLTINASTGGAPAIDFFGGTAPAPGNCGATPTFTVTSHNGQTFNCKVAANITSATLSGASSGDSITFDLVTDATAGRTAVYPTGFTLAPTLIPLANTHTMFSGIWNGSSLVNVQATSDGPSMSPTSAAPTTNPPSGQIYPWFDSTNQGFWQRDAAGNLYRTVIPLAAPGSDHKWVQYTGNDGTQVRTQPSFSDLSGSAAASQLPAALANSTSVNGTTIPASVTLATTGANTFTGRQDASGAASTAPTKTGTTLPGTCTVGDMYFKSDATAGQNLYLCTASNVWTQISTSSGSMVYPGAGIAVSTGTGWGTSLTAPSGSITGTIASGTAALGTSAIASGACATVVTVTATGTATTDVVSWTPNADITAVTGYAPVTTGGLAIYPYPTSNNVNFKVCNPTSSSITPGAVTLNWRVVR